MAYQDVRARLEHIDVTTISRYKCNAKFNGFMYTLSIGGENMNIGGAID